ncbi:MAG: hypothetical protein RR144_02450 [Clostridia bacterium]
MTNYITSILITSFLLGFSGISIIFQIKSTLKNLKISFKKLIIFKLLHGILSVIIAYILLKYSNIVNVTALPIFSNIQKTNF